MEECGFQIKKKAEACTTALCHLQKHVPGILKVINRNHTKIEKTLGELHWHRGN